MFENRVINGVNASRYIVSWTKAGGKINQGAFVDWLRAMQLSDDDVADIYEMATCGKFELECRAQTFLENYNTKKTKSKKKIKIFKKIGGKRK